jgi:hypothetical protein
MFTLRRAEFRGAATLQLGPDLSPAANWSNGAVPTLRNAAELLADKIRAECTLWRAVLHNSTANSVLDGLHGHYEPVVARLAEDTPDTLGHMAHAFTTHVVPLGNARATRVKAWRNWLSILTWALARDALPKILPMDIETLHAALWDFISMGASKSTLKSIVDAVISRHREHKLPSPVTGHMSYFRLTRCLGRLLGTQHPHKFPVTRDMIVQLLRHQPKDLLEFRDKLVTCTLTMGCMRPGEGASATTCCLEYDSDYKRGLLAYKDCSTLVTLDRKNDQERKGHWMRFGKAENPELDLNYQLGLFMDMAGTRPSTACTRATHPGKRCKCPPLFPKFIRGPDGTLTLAQDPTPSAPLISGMVVSALRMIGVDTKAFSGVSCRMGGLTVAIEAGVPEHILWMQSGHAQDRAARRYVRLTTPDRLYDTWRAFRL